MWTEPRFNLIAFPCEKDTTLAITYKNNRLLGAKQKLSTTMQLPNYLFISHCCLWYCLLLVTRHTHLSLWDTIEAGKEFFALQFEVQSNLLKTLCSFPWGGRGGEGREWRGIREVEVWQSEGAGCAVWVCPCKQWSLCIFQSQLGQSNVSSMTLITKVSHFRVPSMEVPLRVCMCMCMCIYVYVCTYVCVCHAWTHGDNTIYPRGRPGKQ